jgi:hypothetical protein
MQARFGSIEGKQSLSLWRAEHGDSRKSAWREGRWTGTKESCPLWFLGSGRQSFLTMYVLHDSVICCSRHLEVRAGGTSLLFFIHSWCLLPFSLTNLEHITWLQWKKWVWYCSDTVAILVSPTTLSFGKCILNSHLASPVQVVCGVLRSPLHPCLLPCKSCI